MPQSPTLIPRFTKPFLDRRIQSTRTECIVVWGVAFEPREVAHVLPRSGFHRISHALGPAVVPAPGGGGGSSGRMGDQGVGAASRGRSATHADGPGGRPAGARDPARDPGQAICFRRDHSRGLPEGSGPARRRPEDLDLRRRPDQCPLMSRKIRNRFRLTITPTTTVATVVVAGRLTSVPIRPRSRQNNSKGTSANGIPKDS